MRLGAKRFQIGLLSLRLGCVHHEFLDRASVEGEEEMHGSLSKVGRLKCGHLRSWGNGAEDGRVEGARSAAGDPMQHRVPMMPRYDLDNIVWLGSAEYNH